MSENHAKHSIIIMSHNTATFIHIERIPWLPCWLKLNIKNICFSSIYVRRSKCAAMSTLNEDRQQREKDRHKTDAKGVGTAASSYDLAALLDVTVVCVTSAYSSRYILHISTVWPQHHLHHVLVWCDVSAERTNYKARFQIEENPLISMVYTKILQRCKG